MAEITASMVKELRERTGAGMMECKKALVEANGDLAAAEEVIAKSGHRKAAKSAGRIAAEGRIAIAKSAHMADIIEVNCETDFVGRGDDFIQFAQNVAEIALKQEVQALDKLLTLPYEQEASIEEARKNFIAKIGENIQIRRISGIKASENQRIGSYVHHGRIGVIVLVEGADEALAKDLAMHIAAMRPQYVTMDDVPAPIIEKEKAIFMEVAEQKQSGKPANIVQKIVEGQLQKHFAEICLSGQPFFKDPDQTIGALLKSRNAKVCQMIRYEVGEGIEVVKKSFEEEVKAARGGSV